jgi:hypothetical protein
VLCVQAYLKEVVLAGLDVNSMLVENGICMTELAAIDNTEVCNCATVVVY